MVLRNEGRKLIDVKLAAPFPWFGGKSKVAPVVWEHFGDVDNYVEPFAGSLAVLLGRPSTHAAKAETVNDLDRYIVNFWRALQADPDGVAYYADSPVNESDLSARHLWLVNEGRAGLERCDADPDFYDAKIAGWWVWGLCAWIGSGWCSGEGPWVRSSSPGAAVCSGKLPHLGDAGQGINRKRPPLGTAGQGINRQLPHLGDAGKGINRQRPHLGNAGQGINRQLPHLGNAGQGINAPIYGYLRALAQRLRRVRVCCGDWQRVVTKGALSYGGTVGVFLDPPYAADTGRDMTLYNHETDVSAAVGSWAIEHGDDPRLRIALCGYEDEHEMPDGWRKIEWTAGASYKSSNGDKTGNRHLERIWFSPSCQTLAPSLFQLTAPNLTHAVHDYESTHFSE